MTSIAGVSGTYCYDANGNRTTSGDGLTIAWTAFDMPSSVSKGTATDTFTYGPEHQRITQRRQDTGVDQTIVYAGAMELVTGSPDVLHVYMPYGLGKMYAGTPPRQRRFFLTDHLGSTTVTTGQGGNFREGYAYDAWGKRRNLNGTDNASPPAMVDDRYGYTGQEMLESVGLVHLNGRVYDSTIGRVVSADPYVPEWDSTQGFNRYSYVGNNPPRYSDPSGFYRLANQVTNWTTFAADDDLPRLPDIEVVGRRSDVVEVVGTTVGVRVFPQFTRSVARPVLAAALRAGVVPLTTTVAGACMSGVPAFTACAGVGIIAWTYRDYIGSWATNIVNIYNESESDGGTDASDALAKPDAGDGGRDDRGATPKAQRPSGVPEDWIERPTNKGGGREWVDPDNRDNRVRSYPGDPNNSNPAQREPYVRDVRNGNMWLDKDGNRIEGRAGARSPATHIPTKDYVYRP